MARYEHLPIYKKAFDLTVYIETVVRHFSRYHKYTLGTELRQKSREILDTVILANSSLPRQPVLLELRGRLESLKVLMRVCKEVKAFNSFNSYAHASEMVVELSRQNEGWIKSRNKVTQERPESPPTGR